jgi:AcrR family transcriptional regulator
MTSETRAYHHGDLRTALVHAGLELSRSGGGAAIGLREVTRSVGVSPNAAYRHFADRQALVLAVALEAQRLLANTIRERVGEADAVPDPAERAVARLRGIGLGYIEFARAEPGWFELAFLTQDEPGRGEPTVTVGEELPEPFRLLLECLDGLQAAGVLTPETRQHAEWACWSTVHGFSDLVTRGPLQSQPHPVTDALAAYVVDAIIRGVVRA